MASMSPWRDTCFSFNGNKGQSALVYRQFVTELTIEPGCEKNFGYIQW